MKKILLLLVSVLFVFGCGGGGGTTVADNTTPDVPGTPGNPANTGYITLVFADTAKATTAALPLPAANRAKIIVRQTAVVIDPDSEEEVLATLYKKIVVATIPGTVNVAVPAGTGYLVDVITAYTEDSGAHNFMIEYGNASGVNVVQGVTTNVTIDISPVAPTLNLPAAMESQIAYNIRNGSNPLPVRTDLNFVRSSTSQITTTFNYDPNNPPASASNFTAPQTATITTLYLQGLFPIVPDFLDAGELWYSWVAYHTTSVPLTPASQLNIIIQ